MCTMKISGVLVILILVCSVPGNIAIIKYLKEQDWNDFSVLRCRRNWILKIYKLTKNKVKQVWNNVYKFGKVWTSLNKLEYA